MVVMAYHDTYKMPVTITRCSNNYGPYHFPEKLIPLIIKNILEGKHLPVYGDGSNVRDWLYVEDHCKAIDLVVREGKDGEVYNVGGHNEKNKPRNRKTDYFNYPPSDGRESRISPGSQKEGERRKRKYFDRLDQRRSDYVR